MLPIQLRARKSDVRLVIVKIILSFHAMDAILNSLVKGVTSLKEDHGRTFAHVVSECIRKDRLRGIYEYQLSPYHLIAKSNPDF